MKKLLFVFLSCLILIGCETQYSSKKDLYEVVAVTKTPKRFHEKYGKYKVVLKGSTYSYLENYFFETVLYTDEKVVPGDKFKLVKVE